jgi:hypothetical protein
VQPDLDGLQMLRTKLKIPNNLKGSLQDNPYLGRRSGFKFHHSKDSKYFFEIGSIKIGTLSEYRNIEKSTLRDENEGIERISIPNNDIVIYDQIHDTSIMRDLFVPSEGADTSTITFQGISIQGLIHEFYCYCFSYECTSHVLHSFMDDDPYDAVAEVTDIEALAQFICNHHPVLRGFGYLYLPIHYRITPRTPRDPRAHASEVAFEKDAQFQNNKEGRLIFVPMNGEKMQGSLSPWVHPGLKQFFRKRDLPD